jgi:PadR family transcriptional regulator, regulatory protein PadR
MRTRTTDRGELVQGTLDMLVLRALKLTPLHGHAIATHIQRTSDGVLHVDHGSLYPALRRLQERGWITAKWEPMPDKNRDAKYYRITMAGKRQLTREHSRWQHLVTAIARVMQKGLPE